ncbi:hypothetical protein HLB35_00070 [Halomonas sp. TBZ9]|uniref:Uncharacterized protein n=1 Tax=Vreelandella azerica TaxID=2732867 RepID=A0A7Y3TVB5_9GAMM|nr:hypothetical protein [Halomonas azerica]NOG30558.1 hypothetical protein [Halomonas azerica]
MNIALIEKAIDGAVEVAKFISGQISENKKQKTEAEREKDRIISDTFNRNLQQLEKAREENRNLNKEVKENLEKHKREESELIARIMEDQKNKFRDYVSMMKSSQEYQNKIFGLHMSWMNNVLNSSQSSMSKMGEVLSSAHDNADFSTQDKLDHIGEVREKIKKLKIKLKRRLLFLIMISKT